MPRKLFAGIAIGTALTIGASFFIYKPKHYVHPRIKITDDVNWTTVENIENSLRNKPPMDVGLDIDDTALFPRTAFHVVTQKHCPEDKRAFKESCNSVPDFWDDINSSAHLSPPKQIGIDIINMHKKRGDKIHFITAREQSNKTPENLTATLKKVFELPDLDPVIFVGASSFDPSKPGKTKVILDNKIKIYYGDSDSDMAAAVQAGIRGIRVIRAPNSQDNDHHRMPINGKYGEEVIIGSDL